MRQHEFPQMKKFEYRKRFYSETSYNYLTNTSTLN
jgi:hypothetical protein